MVQSAPVQYHVQYGGQYQFEWRSQCAQIEPLSLCNHGGVTKQFSTHSDPFFLQVQQQVKVLIHYSHSTGSVHSSAFRQSSHFQGTVFSGFSFQNGRKQVFRDALFSMNEHQETVDLLQLQHPALCTMHQQTCSEAHNASKRLHHQQKQKFDNGGNFTRVRFHKLKEKGTVLRLNSMFPRSRPIGIHPVIKPQQ
jgi:hypothetical protein